MGMKKILLVEDDKDIVKTLKLFLEMENFAVSVAEDGAAALEKINSEKVDLVILDVMLPKVNGYKVCRHIKSEEKSKSIPVIVLTALAQDKDRRLCKSCGAECYMVKPFDVEELKKLIQTLLAK